MYSNNFVAAIKVKGKVLREFNETVALPFGSEYSILLKNLTADKKAKVKVSIDGKDATEDVFLVILPGETTELKRFIRNGNLEAGNAFKFIEKTAQIEAFRGNKAEDGLITVTYEFEKRYDWSNLGGSVLRGYGGGYDGSTRTTWYSNTGTQPDGVQAYASASLDAMPMAAGPELEMYSVKCSASAADSVELSYSAVDTPRSRSVNYSQRSLTKGLVPQAQNTSGITAPGGVVEQQFSSTFNFATDGVKHTITLQLRGRTHGDEFVKEAVIVKKLTRCQMCGTNTKQTAKFCHNCGAAVEIV